MRSCGAQQAAAKQHTCYTAVAPRKCHPVSSCSPLLAAQPAEQRSACFGTVVALRRAPVTPVLGVPQLQQRASSRSIACAANGDASSSGTNANEPAPVARQPGFVDSLLKSLRDFGIGGRSMHEGGVGTWLAPLLPTPGLWCWVHYVAS